MVFVSTGGLINKEAAYSQQSLNMALDKRLAGVVRGMKLKKKKSYNLLNKSRLS